MIEATTPSPTSSSGWRWLNLHYHHNHQHQRMWILTHHKSVLLAFWIAFFFSLFIWQRESGVGFFHFRRGIPLSNMSFPKLRPVVYNLTDFGGIGDGVTLITVAFEKAVIAISKLGKRGGGQLTVPPGEFLTVSFILTSHMTLFLAEGSVILGSEEEKYWPLMPPLPSYGYGREHRGPRYGSLIHGQKLKSDKVQSLLKDIKQATNKSVAIGFGISKPDQVRQVAGLGVDV